jgi:hypothetical protein
MYYERICLARRVICVGWLRRNARTRGRVPRYNHIKAGWRRPPMRLEDSNLWGDPSTPPFFIPLLSSGSPLPQEPLLFIILLLYFSPPSSRAGEFQLLSEEHALPN